MLALKDENPQVRFKSAQALGNVGESAVEPLINMINEEEGEIRRYATFALKKIGSPSAVEYFINALQDEDWGVRKVAARSLGELGDKKALEALVKALDDEDWGVKLSVTSFFRRFR